MKAYQYTLGGGIDDLVVVDLPEPRAGPGQVVVRMRAASLNFRDILVTTGRYPRAQKEIVIPLSDGAGEIADVGAGVSGLAIGDRVCPLYFQSWQSGPMLDHYGETALGGSIDGIAAEYCVFDADKVIRFPDHLSFAEAATLPCAGLTAWNGLHGPVPLVAGDAMLTLGTGGVSIFALQFAAAAGATTIITSSSDKKLERAAALGAHHDINYNADTEWGTAVRTITGGRGVDHVIETGGGGTMMQSVAATRRYGWIHGIGVIAPGAVDPVHMMLAGIIFRGTEVGSRAMFEDMNRSLARSAIHPVIDRSFAFAELPQALKSLAEGSHFGKIVVALDA